MKKLLLAAICASLSACAAGPYLVAHQAVIAAVGVTAGAVAAVETGAVDAITLERDAEGK